MLDQEDPNRFHLRVEKAAVKASNGGEVLTLVDLIVKLGLNKAIKAYKVQETTLEQIF